MTIEEYCDELDAMLTASDEVALSLDEVHGFMSAALCGPRVLSFRDCVCAFFLPEEADAEERECELPADILEMLARLYDDTLRSIEDGSFLPIVSCEQGDGDDEDVDASLWCCGFLMGMEYARSSWRLDTSRVLDLLTPIILLADPREFERAAKNVGSGGESLKQELLEALPESVCALKDFFTKKPRSRRPAPAAKSPARKRRITRR